MFSKVNIHNCYLIFFFFIDFFLFKHVYVRTFVGVKFYFRIINILHVLLLLDTFDLLMIRFYLFIYLYVCVRERER